MKNILFLIFMVGIIACHERPETDLIIYNGFFWTASGDSIEALAVRDNRIFKTGSSEDILALQSENTQLIDAQQGFVMPGLIEGHGHFPNFGKSLRNLNFLKDTSWTSIVEKVESKVAESEKGQWIYGRGWHQEKWRSLPDGSIDNYPTHKALSAITPDNPVVLYHASGHSLFANQKAMELAGISRETPDPRGGKMIRDGEGNPTGVFEERAMDPIRTLYSEYLDNLNEEEQLKEWKAAFDLAQQECLKYGITSFQDAGLTYEELELMEQMAADGALLLRFWVMLRERAENLDDERIQRFRKIGVADHFYTCRAIKSEIDGALGAHGAWLLEPYADKPDFYGQNTTEIEDVERIAGMCYSNEMQLCVHAIGDRANKETLDIIEDYQSKSDENLRWRVEHAQHLNPADIQRFKQTGAIASMQAVHCTSDAPFVEKRLGFTRAKHGAYAWKSLLDQGVIIVNGTDVPVESIDPFENFYASVTRSRLDNGMRFFVEQRMTREEALKSYTIDAAYGAFEEDLKGSLEVGKLADIIILDNNLLKCEDDAIPRTKVLYTIIDGQIKHKSI